VDDHTLSSFLMELGAIAPEEAGGNDEAVGGSLNVLRSLFWDYADPIPAIISSKDNN
jgi:hypothetical protein